MSNLSLYATRVFTLLLDLDLDYKSITLPLCIFTLLLYLLDFFLISLVFSTFFLLEISLVEAITMLGYNIYL